MINRRQWAAGAVVAAVLIGGAVLLVRPGEMPLRPGDDDGTATFHLNGDKGLVDDVDPGIELGNPTDHDIRIIGVETLPNDDSPGRVSVRSFRLAGPDRTTRSISGGLLDEEDYGASLIPARDAVIPAGAAPSDYVLVVRFAGDPDTDWSASRGLRITYEWDGERHEAVWTRNIAYCSAKKLGEKFCATAGA